MPKALCEESKALAAVAADCTRLVPRVVVAAVNSTLYGAEVGWRGQQDRAKRLQLLLNSQARTMTGLLPSTPTSILLTTAYLPWAKELPDHRQKVVCSSSSCGAAKISARMNEPDSQFLFREGSIETVLRFVESMAEGNRRESYGTQQIDKWIIELLYRSSDDGLCWRAGKA